MEILTFVVGPLSTNCFLVYSAETGESVVIDPGFVAERELERIMDQLERLSLKLKYIINTHGHPDHVSGDLPLKERTKAKILIHRLDAYMLHEPEVQLSAYSFKKFKPDMELREDDEIRVGEHTLKVLHTPGHTMGSITLIGEGVAFTGDTLFAGSIGRVDLPHSSPREMEYTLREKILTLPDDLKVYPGHGPATLMGVEKKTNPFLLELKRGGKLS